MKKIFFLLLLSFYQIAHSGQENVEWVNFDSLITKDFLAFGLDRSTGFTYTVETENGVRTYAGSLIFADSDADGHYQFGVSVAPAPLLLDVASYCADRQRLPAHEFPPLGCRAQRKFYGAGPGGSAYGLVFTTSDCRYDVRVFVGMSLPETVADPAFDIDRIAFALSRRYDASLEGKNNRSIMPRAIFRCPDALP